MSFEVNPILEPGQRPAKCTWYAIADESPSSSGCDPDRRAIPGPRVGSCANYYYRIPPPSSTAGEAVGRVLLSAGATPEGPYSDLYQLSFTNDAIQWSSVPTKGLPPRYEHASFISMSSEAAATLTMFAGANTEGPVSDMWRLDLGGGDLWRKVEMGGPIPAPRTFHSSSSFSVSRQELVVFSGGESGTSPVTDNTIHIFNQKTSAWSSPKTSGAPPPPRQGHVAAIVGSRLFVHGGMAGQDVLSDLYTLNLESYEWSSPKVGGTAPPPLAAHACAVIDTNIYMFGGMSPVGQGAHDTLYCLDTELLTWSEVSVVGAPPPSRLDHAMCAVKIPVLTPVQPAKAKEHRAEKEDDNDVITNAIATGKEAASESAESVVTKIEGASDCGGSSSVTVQAVESLGAGKKASFQALTVIDPESASDFTVSAASAHKVQRDVSTEMGGLSVEERDSCAASTPQGGELEATESCDRAEKWGSGGRGGTSSEWVSAVFVFGGMDTLGNIHGDAFILVP